MHPIYLYRLYFASRTTSSSKPYFVTILIVDCDDGKDKMARKSKASSPIRPAPCVDFTKIKPHFQSFQQNDTQGTIDG